MPGGVRTVQIVGLKQLQRDLRALDKTLPRELRKVNLSVAQMVVAKAQQRAAGLGAMTAKAATALKATAEQQSAAVRLTSSVKWAFGAEFGAGHNSPRQRRSGSYAGYNQFRSWLGNGADAGYFMYPTIRAEDDDIVNAYAKRLTELLNQVFPD